MNIIKQKTTMVAALLRSVPVAMTIIFIIAVVLMNFLARITLVSLPWLALNAGITVSWTSARRRPTCCPSSPSPSTWWCALSASS